MELRTPRGQGTTRQLHNLQRLHQRHDDYVGHAREAARLARLARDCVQDNGEACMSIARELMQLIRETPPDVGFSVFALTAGQVALNLRPETPDAVLQAIRLLNDGIDPAQHQIEIWWGDIKPGGIHGGRGRQS